MNSSSNTTNPITTNQSNTTNIIIGVIGVIIFLITFFLTFYYIFPSSSTTKINYTNRASNTGFAILFVILLFIFIGGLFFGMFRGKYSEIMNIYFISQFSNVIYVIIYTIFLVIFFRIINSDIQHRPDNNWSKYVDYITPISILVTAFMFYIGLRSDFGSQYNITYERIKTMILFFCFIAIVITYNSIAPGDFIKNYYGSSLLITILIAIFGFLYLIILLTVPDTSTASTADAPVNFLNYFSKYSSFSTALFFIFLVIVTIGITVNKQILIDNKLYTGIIISVLITSILWGGFILYSKSPFQQFFNDSQAKTTMSPIVKALLALLGISVSGCIIAWLTININSLINNSKNSNTITSFILNFLLILVVLTLIYKTIYTELPYGNARKDATFDLIMSVIFYIPCIFSNIYDIIMNTFVSDYNSATTGTFILIIFMILILTAIFLLPAYQDKIILQGGKLLINDPINTRNKTILANYDNLNNTLSNSNLNNTTQYDYKYALSFWVFLDSMPPSTNESYDKYTSILSYGGKPDILFNPSLNTILVTMKMKSVDKMKLDNKTKFDILDIKETNYDENYLIDDRSIVIVHKMENILLQKWNQFIINCDGGIIDIFYNNVLVKSAIDIIPYMELDNLSVGQERGIYGGICNVVYYTSPLNVTQMYYSYNTVKSSDPPITNKTNKTITKYLN
jgi:TRAP-type mannitol/chloroaromatic compound transport system permease small subunit